MERVNASTKITNSLSQAVRLFKECGANYRIVGSVLIVAHTGKVFRRIADLDVLLEAEAKECVLAKLKQNGFKIINKKAAGFHWIEAEKKGFLTMTFLLVGDFIDDYFRYRFLGGSGELRINYDYLAPTEYNYGGVTFVGLPISSVIAGINQSFLNPKRKYDKKVLQEEIKNSKRKTYGNISVYLFGIKIPYLYDFFSFVYNIFGGVRVIFGKSWDTWK